MAQSQRVWDTESVRAGLWTKGVAGVQCASVGVGGGVLTSSIAGRSDGVGLQHSDSSCERAAGHALLKG